MAKSVGVSAGAVVSFARPGDTTAYAANDAVANSTSAPVILTFTPVARVAAGAGFITKAKLQTDQSACVARFRLHLFNVANPTIANDNAAFALKWADRASYIGSIDFDACKTEGTGSDTAYSINSAVRMHFTCASGDQALYGLLETLDAFTPANAQNFRIALATDLY